MSSKESLNSILDKQGIRLDQKLAHAIRLTRCMPILLAHGLEKIGEDGILHALIRLNSSLTRHLALDHVDEQTIRDALMLGASPSDFLDPAHVPPSDALKDILSECAKSMRDGVITTGNFLASAAQYALDAKGGAVAYSYRIADFFATVLSLPGTSGRKHHHELREVLKSIQQVQLAEDFQYAVTIAGDRLAFRVIGNLGDYVQRSESGLLVPQRALLTHTGNIGLFSDEQIKELEELINSPTAKELDFQRFFERNPHFLRKWDHREVHPQVYLTMEEENALIPDFILTDPELQNATIVDLKRPQPKIIVHQDNRVRFAAAVMEARAQLQTYSRYFEQHDNRSRLRELLGMDVYHPHLAVIIGRSSEFNSPLERQKLVADTSDIEIVTYDDILVFAKRRRFIIQR